MPQTFQVLRCYKCLVFQVHQTKKSIKWECKLCGEKQSIKRHYGIGTGKDCRIHVQKLNNIRGEINELKCSQMQRNAESDEETITQGELQLILPQQKLTKESKWSNYVEEEKAFKETSEEPISFGDVEVVLELPKKKRKQFNNYSRNNYYTKSDPSASSNFHVPYSSNPIYKNNKSLSHSSSDPEPIVENVTVVNPTGIIAKVEKENSKPNVQHLKTFIPPTINKNSKWAQFADEEEAEVTSIESLQPLETNQNIFSLCDDGELDNILDL